MSDAHHQQPLEEDSGSLPRLSTRGWVAVIFGLAALTAVAAWYGFGSADQDARWKTVGYSIDSPTHAEITFDVHVYADEPVECVARAMNISFAEVGIATHMVDPDDGRTQRITLPITTVEEATTAEVNYCAVPE